MGVIGLGGTVAGFAGGAQAANFTAGNVVVYRVGTGVGSLGTAASAVFLDEYSTSLVQSIAMPTSDSGANQTLTAAGSDTLEGLISRSTDNRYLVLGGYDAVPGTANVSGTSVGRTIGRVSASTVVNTSTTITSTFNAAHIRGVASTNGTALWATGSTGGIVYTNFGTTAAGTVVNSTSDLRQPGIFNGQLYTTSGGTRVGKVGTGTPTTTGQTISNTNIASGGDVYQFFMADLSPTIAGLDTAYVAYNDASALKKYSLSSGGVWQVDETIGNNSSNYRGLVGSLSGSTVTLYTVRNGTALEKIVDTGGYAQPISGNPVLIATAAANTAFRGVAFTPQQGNFTVGASLQLNLLKNSSLATTGGLTVTNTAVTADQYSATASSGLTASPSSAMIAGSGGTGTINVGVTSASNYGTQTGTITVTPNVTGSNVSNVTAIVGNATVDRTHNDRSHFGTTLVGKISSGSSYATLESRAFLENGATGGNAKLGTVATVRAGIASGDTTVAMAWRTRNTNEVSGSATSAPFGASSPNLGLASDVVNFTGIHAAGGGSFHGSIQTDTFVLQMSYDPQSIKNITSLDEPAAAAVGLIGLGYLDLGNDGQAGTNDDRWSLAVAGNFGGTSSFVGNVAFSDFGNAGLSDDLGRWGVDTNNHVAWAVLNHNSQFAVVPEPSTLAISGLVGASMLTGRRRRDRRAANRSTR